MNIKYEIYLIVFLYMFSKLLALELSIYLSRQSGYKIINFYSYYRPIKSPIIQTYKLKQ